ncbi:MAG: PD40 domain-containing protein, partial [Candidatus Aminicenantes bacterium]|nr:PD40 domain-containing protein [Candidatus Aminicenantes bacterium]
ELFEEIIRTYPNERDYAARSLYLMGTCYERLGERQAQQAQATFQRIVQDYPDQTEEVNLAKEKLLVFEKAQVPARTGEGEFRIRKAFPFGGITSFSLDGRFLTRRDDSGDLAVIDIPTGKKRLLTNSASWEKGDFVSVSKISPDNQRVAYSWCQNYTDQILKIINLDGSGQRVLHSGKIDYRDEAGYFWPVGWTFDGQHILGILDRAKTRQFCFMAVTDGSLRIVGDPQKADQIELTEAMALSPDGRWIAYDRPQDETSGKCDIILMKADGSRETPLVKHPASDRLLGWTPNGESVLMVSDRSGSWDAWIITVKDGNAQGDPILVKRDFGQVGGPTGVVPLGFTQDGSFYYEARLWMDDVYTATLDVEKGELLTPPKKAAQRFEGTNGFADWSPDGRYLAFSSERDPQSSVLCLLSLDGGEQKDIFPPGLGNFVRVNWHPDGKSVVVVDRRGIYRVDIESGKASPVVTEGAGFHSPRCTPDGKYVYYEEDTSWEDKVFRIMRVDLGTKEKKEMYRSTQQIIRMDISPDGRSLAFLEWADRALKIMPFEVGRPQVVYKFNEGWATSVAWSPDGKYLFFAKMPEGEGKTGRIELWRIPSNGGEPVKFPLVTDGMQNLRIHPDGKRIAFNTFTVHSETWVMENFLPKSSGGK